MDIIQKFKNKRYLGHFMAEQRDRNLALLVSRFSLSREQAEDIYQDACIALYQNIQNGTLNTLTAKISTYFTSICINLAKKACRREVKETVSVNDPYNTEIIDVLVDSAQYDSDQKNAIEYIVTHLPSPCNEILELYYYDGESMATIAEKICYKNADSVKSRKVQCMGLLKNKFDTMCKAE